MNATRHPTSGEEPRRYPTARVGVDVGGTFTDLVACDDAGRMSALKVPTTPANPAGGLLNGLTAIGQTGGRCA
jgi:N-methylhydantoinase A